MIVEGGEPEPELEVVVVGELLAKEMVEQAETDAVEGEQLVLLDVVELVSARLFFEAVQ